MINQSSKIFKPKFNILILIGILTTFYLVSCKSNKEVVNVVKSAPTSCDTTKMELKFVLNSNEYTWLNTNEDKCIRINEFFRMFGYTSDCIEYMKSFVQIKVTDEEFKLERFIELYCLLNQNPNALIDGSLNRDKKN